MKTYAIWNTDRNNIKQILVMQCKHWMQAQQQSWKNIISASTTQKDEQKLWESFKPVSLCFALMVWNCSSRGPCLERPSFISMLPGTVKGITCVFFYGHFEQWRQIRREGVARTSLKVRSEIMWDNRWWAENLFADLAMQNQTCFHLLLLCGRGIFPWVKSLLFSLRMLTCHV